MDEVIALANPDFLALDPRSYSLAIHVFVRLIGVLYLIVYIPFLFQIRGLIGRQGIRPLEDYLNMIKERLGLSRFYYVPTLFWINASDTALFVLLWSGIFFAVLLIFGIFPPLMLFLLYLIHLSLTYAGQEFMRFGWETLLMEMTMATTLLVATSPPNIFAWWSLNFLLIRFHIEAGYSKLRSHDKTWRDLTATSYHYLTQPIPNATAWYVHKLPMWVHKTSTVFTFYLELIVPLFVFSPPEVRLFVFANLVLLQFIIWFTGNLSYLNYLTTVFCVILINNQYLTPYLGPPPILETSSIAWYSFISLLGALLFSLQVLNLWQYFFLSPFCSKVLIWFEPTHTCHPHQLFSMMTVKRYEIVVEGSYDGVNWKEYLFYYKPSQISRRPQRISPYQPRLDWQAWFLPFAPFQQQWWFHQFLMRLLQGSPPVLKLLAYNPFDERPPQFVRALVYDYEFTTWEEKKRTGNWWKRRLIGEYAPSIRLLSEEEKKK